MINYENYIIRTKNYLFNFFLKKYYKKIYNININLLYL